MSATIRHDLEQYYALLYFVGEEMRGYFSIDEASHLCDVFRSTSMDIQRLKSWPSFLAWDVEEVEKYEKLGVGAGIEIERLIDKLENSPLFRHSGYGIRFVYSGKPALMPNQRVKL